MMLTLFTKSVLPPKNVNMTFSWTLYLECNNSSTYDDVIKWKYFPRYWPFVRGIHRSPVDLSHKGLWRGALMFSFINGWANTREAGDLRRHRAHYDVTVMYIVTLHIGLQPYRMHRVSRWSGEWGHHRLSMFGAYSVPCQYLTTDWRRPVSHHPHRYNCKQLRNSSSFAYLKSCYKLRAGASVYTDVAIPDSIQASVQSIPPHNNIRIYQLW